MDGRGKLGWLRNWWVADGGKGNILCDFRTSAILEHGLMFLCSLDVLQDLPS